jgi:hypothetical protein
MPAVMHFVGMVRAGQDTLATVDAAFGNVAELGFGSLSFRIVTPEAAHGASFEEDRGSDARSIVQRKPLNVENEVRSFHRVSVQGGYEMV